MPFRGTETAQSWASAATKESTSSMYWPSLSIILKSTLC